VAAAIERGGRTGTRAIAHLVCACVRVVMTCAQVRETQQYLLRSLIDTARRVSNVAVVGEIAVSVVTSINSLNVVRTAAWYRGSHAV
jgi:hypothetical protein